jgi:Uma2 family endonuclease
MGVILLNLGQYEKSEEMNSISLNIFKNYYGENHIRAWIVRENSGYVKCEEGKYQESYEIFLKSL